jgi:hypothetical protein
LENEKASSRFDEGSSHYSRIFGSFVSETSWE